MYVIQIKEIDTENAEVEDYVKLITPRFFSKRKIPFSITRQPKWVAGLGIQITIELGNSKSVRHEMSFSNSSPCVVQFHSQKLRKPWNNTSGEVLTISKMKGKYLPEALWAIRLEEFRGDVILTEQVVVRCQKSTIVMVNVACWLVCGSVTWKKSMQHHASLAADP